VFDGIVTSKGIRALICVGDTYRKEASSPPTVNVVGKGMDCADCAITAKPPPKMLTHGAGGQRRARGHAV
jgi:hypothetical protein